MVDTITVIDPSLREWPAPAGVLATPEGLRSTFVAMGFRSVVDGEAATGVRFEAWHNPRFAGAVLAAGLGVAIYLGLMAAGAPESWAVLAVILEAFYVPLWVLPSYRISGGISGGTLRLRITARGLLAQRGRLERTLRFYLDRT